MISDKISGKTNASSYYGTWINWVINNQSIEKNTSNITVTVYVQRIDSYTGLTAYNLDVKPTVTLKVGGVTKSPTINYIDTRNHKLCTVATWTGDVSHNSDGTLSLDLSCSWRLNNNYLYSGDISGTAILDTIPRASKITSVSGTTIGGTMTIKIARAVSTFKHNLWYKVGNSVWYAYLDKNIETEHSFTIDIETAEQLPNSMSGNMQLRLITFDGDTQIGDDYYHNVTVNVPEYTPTISNIALTGNNLLSGAYIQEISTLTAEVSAYTRYGATIKSYSSKIDGKEYTGSSFTTSALRQGLKSVTTTITDSRGRTATLTSSEFTVYAYDVPKISKFTLERQEDGTTVIATVRGTVSAVNNKNSKTLTVTLNGVTKTITPSSYTINDTITFTNVPTDNTFTATAKLTDSFTSATKESVLTTVAVTMDFHYSGKGMAIGKVSETKGLFEVDWDAQFNKAVNIKRPALELLSITRTDSGNGAAIKFANKNGVLGYVGMSNNANSGLTRWTHDASSSYIVLDTGNTKDYIVEQGSNGIWTYRKWDSGIAECWCTYTHETAASKSWGSMYYSDSLTPRINYPFTFTDRPIENVTFKGETSAGWLYTEGGGFSINSTTQSGQYGICRPTQIGSSKLVFDYYVIGTWK